MTHLPLVVCCDNVFLDVVAGVGMGAGVGAEVGAKNVVLVIVVAALPSVTGVAGVDVV